MKGKGRLRINQKVLLAIMYFLCCVFAASLAQNAAAQSLEQWFSDAGRIDGITADVVDSSEGQFPFVGELSRGASTSYSSTSYLAWMDTVSLDLRCSLRLISFRSADEIDLANEIINSSYQTVACSALEEKLVVEVPSGDDYALAVIHLEDGTSTGAGLVGLVIPPSSDRTEIDRRIKLITDTNVLQLLQGYWNIAPLPLTLTSAEQPLPKTRCGCMFDSKTGLDPLTVYEQPERECILEKEGCTPDPKRIEAWDRKSLRCVLRTTVSRDSEQSYCSLVGEKRVFEPTCLQQGELACNKDSNVTMSFEKKDMVPLSAPTCETVLERGRVVGCQQRNFDAQLKVDVKCSWGKYGGQVGYTREGTTGGWSCGTYSSNGETKCGGYCGIRIYTPTKPDPNNPKKCARGAAFTGKCCKSGNENSIDK